MSIKSPNQNVAAAAARTNGELNGQIRLPPDEDGRELVVGLDEIERRRRWRRGVFVLVVFFLLAGSGMLFFFLYGSDSHMDDLEDVASDPRLQRYQTPADAESCPDWPEGQDKSSTISFQIPTSAGLMLFASRGQIGGGTFHLDHADRSAPRDTISVSVTAQFDDRRELEHTKACRVENTGRNEHGLLLWAKSSLTHKVTFNVAVLLPDIQNFGDLTTDLNNFEHGVANFFDLRRPVGFGVVRLKSSNAPMVVSALMAESGFFQTSNAQLQAGFMGAYQVKMHTSNAPLHAIVWAFGPANGAQMDVDLRTSNSPADVFLAMASDYNNTKMSATVHASNGRVNVAMPRAMQPDGEVFLDVSTSNAPVSVFLHPEYEGTYDLRTTVADAELLWDPDLRDPTGKGRKKTLIEESKDRTWKTGRMLWGDEQTIDGSIRVRSSVEPVKLYSNPWNFPRMDDADVFGQSVFNVG
ncbi:hypothetical protein BDN70DRAFT_878224 [Pholiota conissans]|uniref:Uncharacterized protein n=1 Tax=Pholiota conissans TaxID=109636 RepID=A0A9P5Z316_9AGAR|nr:hypothetical protein BDN70DRAFT_878224 [Pholiota conissans]